MSGPVVYVCDGCMAYIQRRQIAVWADGEHVLCHLCDEAERHDPRDVTGGTP